MYVWCWQRSRSASESFEYEDLMLSLIPSGGSVTTFNALCRIPRGNLSVGAVVSHSLKFGSGFYFLSSSDSIMTSSSFNQEVNKWQFSSNTQWPLVVPALIRLLALSPIPWPNETYLNCFAAVLLPSFCWSQSFSISSCGSAPGDKI